MSGSVAGGGRPKFAGPALAVICALAALLYGWGMGHNGLHPYYTAAVHSMASSPRAFFFGALDPAASITIDKLPGSLWVQAASVRMFGPKAWAVALPQAIEGVLAVWLLYRVVRRWAGDVAALLAAFFLAITPITVALNRHNISDTLLTLLLICGADACWRAVENGRLRWLLLCGVWVGLAFQTKMMQAWLVVPVFGLVYLVAAAPPVKRRLVHLVAFGVVTVAVSCAWLVVVLLTPAHARPYVDATTGNNPFSMVFGYNGIVRFGGSGEEGSALGSIAPTATLGNHGWNVLVNRAVGPQISWLMPLAVLALAAGLLWSRRAPRTDPTRAGYLLWGGWLLIHVAAFSASSGIHQYYSAVLAPAIAALAGVGLVAFWHGYVADRRRAWLLPAAIALSAAWATVLGTFHSRFLPWLVPTTIGAAVVSTIALLALRPRSPSARPSMRTATVLLGCFGLGVASLSVSPAAWAVSTLVTGYGGRTATPFAGPEPNTDAKAPRQPMFGFTLPKGRTHMLLNYLQEHRLGEKYLVATQSAYLAEPLLRATTESVLPMGGFTGLTPFPQPDQLSEMVAGGRVRYVLLTAARPGTPTTAWVKGHCERVPPAAYRETSDVKITLYDCRP